MSNEYITIPKENITESLTAAWFRAGFQNLLVAGRASARQHAAGAIRFMPPCMALVRGGHRAAMSSLAKTDVGELEVRLCEKS